MIPFNRPHVGPRAGELLARVAASTHHSGDGPVMRECQATLSEILEGATVVLTPSCTHALELAALVLDIREGDEVVVPSFTFTSTATAFALRGARLRFADIQPETLNMDPESVRSLITERTRAVVPVHYAGVACDMVGLEAVLAETAAAVVEDNAHGLFGRLGGRPLGTFGRLATLSFHETKNVSAGEGGALIINDERLLDAVHVARDKGTNRRAFLSGLVDKYTWVGLGSSWLPSEFTAALLLAGLLDAHETQSRRSRIWGQYQNGLDVWAKENGVSLPSVPDGADHPAHLFYLVLPDQSRQTSFIAHMSERGVQVVFHYQPLHLATAAGRYGSPDPCPLAESLAARLVRLPLYADLASAEVDHVVDAVSAFNV